MAKYCKRCGTDLKKGMADCPRCGQPTGSPGRSRQPIGQSAPGEIENGQMLDDHSHDSKGLVTAKLIIGIISIALFFLIAFQSCAAGIVNTIGSTGEVSGSAGMVLAFCMLIGGVVGIVSRRSKGGGITAGMFYGFGSGIGFMNLGVFGDLVIWSTISFIFGVVFFLGSMGMDNGRKSGNRWYQKNSPLTIGIMVVSILFFAVVAVGLFGGNDDDSISQQQPESLPTESYLESSTEVHDEDDEWQETAENSELTESVSESIASEISYWDSFEFDGLEITFGNEIEWAVLENQFSDHDGSEVFLVPVIISNRTEDTHGLSLFNFTQYGSDGIKLDSTWSYFREYDFTTDMRSGATLESKMPFLYTGDGDYYVEFSQIFGESVEVKLPISKQ